MADAGLNGAAEDRIREIVEEVLAGSSLFVVDLHVKGRKGSQIVEVFIDGDEAPDVAELSRVSREVGFLLETKEVLGGAYNLNVSSPGADRPLLLPRQFRKHVGRKLKVKYSTEDTSATVEGTLDRTDEEGMELRTAKGEAVRIPFAGLIDARVQLPW